MPPAANVTLAQLLTWAEAELAAHGITTPRLDAEVLLAHSLGTNRAGLYARLHSVLSPSEIEAFQQLLHRRLRHEPGQYITGVQEFWSLEFAVDRRVLIPRPETVLHLLRDGEGPGFSPHSFPRGAREFSGKVLDIGTGSGCIAIALATELPNADIWATDISLDALAVAAANAQRHHVHRQIHFLQGDLFAPFAAQELRFDAIVSNPPYIVPSDFLTLQPEVRDWEPRSALDGGKEGIDFYRRLLSESLHYLSASGWLALEIGHNQGAAVLHLVEEQPGWANARCLPDAAGCDRVVVVQKRC